MEISSVRDVSPKQKRVKGGGGAWGLPHSGSGATVLIESSMVGLGRMLPDIV